MEERQDTNTIAHIGTIYFDRMTAEKTFKSGKVKANKIFRTNNKSRARPNPASRHSDGGSNANDQDNLRLINRKDLEWLSWNWRGWNGQ